MQGRQRIRGRIGQVTLALGDLLRRPELLIFVPALALAAFWLGGEHVMILTALGLPLLFAMAGAFRPSIAQMTGSAAAGLAGMMPQAQLITRLDGLLHEAAIAGRQTGCLVVQFDDAAELLDRHGRAAQAEVLAQCADRLWTVLREGDVVARLEGGGFAIALQPTKRIDLELLVQVSNRLQAVMASPISLNATRIYVSVSVGFCLGIRAPLQNGASLLDAAQIAADEALRHGPGAIRGYAADMARRRSDRDALCQELELALDEGRIRPHFQPQINADTGAITGFEALARWHHPDRGLIPPMEFLPAVEEAGLCDRLSEAMLYHALTALAGWDKAGLQIPRVSINLAATELRNPKLADNLKWELDRFNLAPERLSIEVLETVVAETDNDIIVRNIAALASLGCGIDMDDFGTGHASIGNIRRFSIGRIKIDRSFVTHVDRDPEQRKIVAAILSMAERLGMETLAEGVETAAEQAILAQLGCNHVQGFHIARPMPVEKTEAWIRAHCVEPAQMMRIGQRAH
ncbi:MAG: putative bifunctional diguanylate cyclase/phosphodiesterase [Pseudorhodobacter sp.]